MYRPVVLSHKDAMVRRDHAARIPHRPLRSQPHSNVSDLGRFSTYFATSFELSRTIIEQFMHSFGKVGLLASRHQADQKALEEKIGGLLRFLDLHQKRILNKAVTKDLLDQVSDIAEAFSDVAERQRKEKLVLEVKLEELKARESALSSQVRMLEDKLRCPTNDSTTDQSLQHLRDEVRAMVKNRAPMYGIPQYAGFREHGDSRAFFCEHYRKYAVAGSEVIFTPDLKAIDERLLNALRNLHARNLPLGDVSQRTDAIAAGRFSDGEDSLKKALVSISFRERRARPTVIDY